MTPGLTPVLKNHCYEFNAARINVASTPPEKSRRVTFVRNRFASDIILAAESVIHSLSLTNG
jgi:hypothetical protein